MVLVVVAVVVAFSCWRWTFANDAQDIQGTWYIAGTQKTVDVTADGIKLADDVTYSYTIDEGAKTLSLSFGNMEGEARYRFSLDRQTLALRDGETTWGNSLSEDISWTIAALGRAIQGEQASPELSGDSTMVLTRAPQDLSSEGASGAAASQAASQGTASGRPHPRARDGSHPRLAHLCAPTANRGEHRRRRPDSAQRRPSSPRESARDFPTWCTMRA